MTRDTPPPAPNSTNNATQHRASWKVRFSKQNKDSASGGSIASSDATPKSISKRFRHLLPKSPKAAVPAEEENEENEQQEVSIEAAEVPETASSSTTPEDGAELLEWKSAIQQIQKEKQNMKEKDGFCRRVDSYDGQAIIVDQKAAYEIGNYLGGGVAGVVYEGHRLLPISEYPVRDGSVERQTSSLVNESSIAMEVTLEDENTHLFVDQVDAPNRSRHYGGGGLEDETVAVKILNPVGFRMIAPDQVEKAICIRQGLELDDDMKAGKKPLTDQHVWWLVNPNSRNLRTLQRFSASHSMSMPSSNEKKRVVDRGSPEKGLRLSLVAAYMDPETSSLKELPLTKCIEIWGHIPFSASDAEFEEMMEAIERVNAGHPTRSVPVLPNKFIQSQSNTSLPSRVATENSSGSMSVDESLKAVALAPKRTGLYRAAASSRSTMYCAELNAYIAVPAVPPKYLRWLRQRRAATKEIRNMMLIGRHKNVVHLYEVLEQISQNKSTMFLILELVQGGELFDLISSNGSNKKLTSKKVPPGWDESEWVMRKFFCELASGIYYCHANGIAHRDLKPENLLVHNDGDECTLKIADFGLSATFFTQTSDQDTDVGTSVVSSPTQSPSRAQSFSAFSSPQKKKPESPIQDGIQNISALGAAAMSYLTCGAVVDIVNCGSPSVEDAPPSPLRRMTSVVGSPHYVAPEIISQTEKEGYDGTKADVWSAGVILYAMLFRSLPFGEDLLRCPRYQSFCKWYAEARVSGRRASGASSLVPLTAAEMQEGGDGFSVLGPHWFFPSKTSVESRDLIIAMLNPDPQERLSIQMVLQHPWILKDTQQQPQSEERSSSFFTS